MIAVGSLFILAALLGYFRFVGMEWGDILRVGGGILAFAIGVALVAAGLRA